MSGKTGVDMRPVKAILSQALPPGDPLLQSVLQEPDWLSKEDGIPKLTVYFRLWVEHSRRERGGRA